MGGRQTAEATAQLEQSVKELTKLGDTLRGFVTGAQ